MIEFRKDWIGWRRGIFLAIGLSGVWAVVQLQLDFRQLIPSRGGVELISRFFSGAVSPAVTYEADFVPQGTVPLLVKVMRAVVLTVVFAVTSASLSMVLGLVLGVFASAAWWVGEPLDTLISRRTMVRRTVMSAIYFLTRILITLLRSVHELIWAMLFMAITGLTNFTAIIAIAIPYTGFFAKIVSEMLDEAPRNTAVALQAVGASPMKVFAFGLMPRVMPNLLSYSMYRFECALRSSAVLGFFGIPTLGYYLLLSFQNSHYREVWTYLYAVFALVAIVDWWSGALRRRMVV